MSGLLGHIRLVEKVEAELDMGIRQAFLEAQADGMGIQAIARMWGISYTALLNWVRRYRIPVQKPKHWTKSIERADDPRSTEHKVKVEYGLTLAEFNAERHAQGRTVAQRAAELGICPQAYRRAMKRSGVQNPSMTVTKKVKQARKRRLQLLNSKKKGERGNHNTENHPWKGKL